MIYLQKTVQKKSSTPNKSCKLQRISLFQQLKKRPTTAELQLDFMKYFLCIFFNYPSVHPHLFVYSAFFLMLRTFPVPSLSFSLSIAISVQPRPDLNSSIFCLFFLIFVVFIYNLFFFYNFKKSCFYMLCRK